MLPRVDYLTVHTPLTPETKNLIDHREIEKLKPGVRLINCARGGIYDEQALAEALRAASWPASPWTSTRRNPARDSPLFGLPGALCTPHLGASTEEAQTQVAVEAVELLVNFLTTGEIRHAVNMAAVDPKTLESLRGYLDVAIAWDASWPNGIRAAAACHLNYRGEVADKDTSLLTSSFCAGLLESAMDEDVNIVNAECCCRNGASKWSQKADPIEAISAPRSLAELMTTSGTYRAGGTLFGNNMPRLIRLDDYRLEAYLDGTLFVFTHQDVPGIIGTVGTIFGEHQINIAQMAVGRAEPGRDAVGVLNLDSIPRKPRSMRSWPIPTYSGSRWSNFRPPENSPRGSEARLAA